MAIVLCSQLPISRLILYGVFSFLLSCFAVWRCALYFSHETDGYDSPANGRHVRLLESAMRDNCVVVAAFNLFFFLLITVVKVFQHCFFGPLVGTEPHFIREKSMHFALSRAVFLIGVINAAKWSSLMGWTLWFGCLGCLHGFAFLARLRCEQLIARNSTSLRQWLRFGSMLIALTCGTVALLSSGVKFCCYLSDVTPEADIFGEIGLRHNNEARLKELAVSDYPDDSSADFYQILHTLVFIFSDSASVLFLLLHVALIIIVNELDGTKWIHQKTFFDKAIWLYNVNLIFDVISLTLDLSNHVHMLIWTRLASLTSLVVCIQVIVSYGDLAQRIRRHSAYRNLVKIIRREFPLEQIDRKTVIGINDVGENKLPEPETCAICWELLWTWRKLPCRHCFHETCLTMWIEEDPSCPTCRRPVLPRTQRPRTQQRMQQPPALNTLRDIINFFSREDSAALPQQNAENQRAIRGVSLRLRQRSVAPNNRNTRAAGRSLDISIHVSLGPRRPSAPQISPQPSADVQGANLVAAPDQQPQTQIIQSTTRSRIYHFDGSNYLSWLPTIDIEFVETEQNVSPLLTNQSPVEPTTAVTQQPQLRSASLLSRLPRLSATAAATVSNSQDLHTPIQPLSSALRAQAEQISAAFPAIPLDTILADLAVTRVPEATVENILSGQIVATSERPLVEERPRNVPSSSNEYEVLEGETQVRNRSVAQLLSGTLASSTPAVEVHETGTPGCDAHSSQQQQTTPSSVTAHRRHQMLVRARQRFLAAQRH